MSVVINSAIAGEPSADNPPINVVLPSDQQIDIDHTDDSIAIGTPTKLFTSTDSGLKTGLDVNVISGSITPSGTQDVNIVSSVELEIKNDSGNPVPISASSLPLPTGASTAANQTTANASLSSIDSKLTSPITVTGPLTDTQLRASPVSISGTVTADAGSGDFTVVQATGSNLHTVIDSGTLTSVTTVDTITNVVHVDDNAGSITVDNSGTFAVQAAQSGSWSVDLNAGSNTIGVVDQGIGGASAWKVDGSAVTQPVSAVSLPLPSGAATAANQATEIASLANLDVALSTRLKAADTLAAVTTVGTITNVVHVDDNSGSLTVDNAGTFAVQAAQSGTWTVQPGNTANTVAWKVDGSAVTQPVSGTVTATIAAGASTIAKAEDSASADEDVGVPALAVRKATPANTSGTDGDYEFLQMSAGRLWTSTAVDTALPAGTNAIGKLAANDGVDIGDVTINNASGGSAVNIQDGGNSITVDNGGTFAVQSTIAASATNIAKAEDAASADADVGVPAMAVRKASPANTSGTDGDYEMLQMSAGRLWTSTTVDAALPAGSNAIGKLAANSGVIIGDVNVVNSNVSTNIAQINGVTPLMGNGVTGTGSPRVTIASDNTAFTVNAAQSGTWTAATKVALTASSPTSASVGVASAQAVASNSNRKGLVLTNTSTNNISFGIGATAVLNSGITLIPGGVWSMDEYNFATGAINAIAGGASSNLAIQEFTT